MDKIKIARFALKELKKRGAEEAIAEATCQKQSQLKFVDNSIVATTNWELSALNLFAVWSKRVLSTSIENISEKAVRDSVASLASLAKYTQPNKDFSGIAKGPFSYKPVKSTFDRKILDMGNNAVGIVEEGINIALAQGAKRVSGNFEHGSSESHLISSENAEAESRGTSAYFSIRSFYDRGSSGQKTACSRMLDKLDHRYAAKKSGEYAVLGKNPGKINAGKYDMIFDPMAFAVLLDNVAQAASVFSVESGLSFLAGKIGNKVARPEVTLTDSATLENGFNSSFFDDEGFPTGKHKVIDRGILKTFLHNSSTAKKYNAKNTGNAGLVAPEPWNTVLSPGKISSKKLIKNVDKGLYITNLWYTRYQNHATGDFSTIPRDSIFFIRNGNIARPVNDIRISDNMNNILKNISMISSQPEQVFNWETEKPVMTPFVSVENVNVSKSA